MSVHGVLDQVGEAVVAGGRRLPATGMAPPWMAA
jgi:hypothetical protein